MEGTEKVTRANGTDKWSEVMLSLQDLLVAANEVHKQEVLGLRAQLELLQAQATEVVDLDELQDVVVRSKREVKGGASPPPAVNELMDVRASLSGGHSNSDSQNTLAGRNSMADPPAAVLTRTMTPHLHPPDRPTVQLGSGGASLETQLAEHGFHPRQTTTTTATLAPTSASIGASMLPSPRPSTGGGASHDLLSYDIRSSAFSMSRTESDSVNNAPSAESGPGAKHKAACHKARSRANHAYAQMAARKQKLSIVDSKDEVTDAQVDRDHFHPELLLRDNWEVKDPVIQRMPTQRKQPLMGSTMSIAANSPLHHSLHESTPSHRRSCGLAGWVTHPSSSKRLVWDVMGMILLMMDSFLIPLQAFSSYYDDESTELISMTLVTTTYWSTDIFASFMVGFHVDGAVEMSLAPIARHYLLTWFPFDVVLVAIDWPFLFGVMQRVSYLRAGKTLSRGFRIVRLLRIVKIHNFINSLMERMHSEFTKAIFNIFLLVIFIITLNHFIACGWYGLGSTLKGEYDSTWVEYYLTPEDDLGYRYTTSLHWSLTQFTPASMEVVPKNAAERSYSVCVLLFALITFSSFVSSITSEMTHIRMLNSRKLETQSKLRKYLRERGISRKLISGVWHFLDSKDWKNRVTLRIKEQDVTALNILPPAMRRDLRVLGRAPHMKKNPFFGTYATIEPNAFYLLCDSAVSELSLLPKQELFGSTSVVKDIQMVFVLEGVLDYWLPCSCGADTEASMENAEAALYPSRSKLSLSELVKKIPTLVEEVSLKVTSSRVSRNSGRGQSAAEDHRTMSCRDRIYSEEWVCEAALWASDLELSCPLIAAEITEVLLVDPAIFHDVVMQFKLTAESVAWYGRAFVKEVPQMIGCRWRLPVALNVPKLQEMAHAELTLPGEAGAAPSTSRSTATRSSWLRGWGISH